jgi:hypothetical protein
MEADFSCYVYDIGGELMLGIVLVETQHACLLRWPSWITAKVAQVKLRDVVMLLWHIHPLCH